MRVGGVPVTVLDMNREALDAGLSAIRDTYAGSVSRGSLAQPDMDERVARIDGTTGYADIGDADIVIEAVFEDMALKKQVFGTLDEVCKPGAILATNTSTLDVNEIACPYIRHKSCREYKSILRTQKTGKQALQLFMDVQISRQDSRASRRRPVFSNCLCCCLFNLRPGP